ncbi:hypothetical protein DFP73DRAFT_598329 [Morchella snyderi]|nr:hypothetical protein DFP73DRAFT_598329 [Morchella snyderi]
MSPNWREKEAMSTQKLMAATTHLHLKEDEEITRLRRNVSSLAKKNHGLMRQVHELVSKLGQDPPPRIPDETRQTKQDEESQKETSPENKEDVQMEDMVELETDKDDDSYYSLSQPRPGKPESMPQPSKEYDILPDCVEAPTPSPTPPHPTSTTTTTIIVAPTSTTSTTTVDKSQEHYRRTRPSRTHTATGVLWGP